MPVTRIVLLLSVVGVVTLFALSNLSPVLSVVFLGTRTVPLPLAAWIGIAIAAGAITSFVLQILNASSRSYSTRRVADVRDVPPRSRSFYRESPEPEPEPEAPEPEVPYTPPPPETPPRSATSDWEERVGEDWNFDEEPAASVSERRDFDSERPTSPSPGDRQNFEVKQEPTTRSQTGSVYSYGYRNPSESGVGKTEAVYDANYRVIMPPYKTPSDQEEDDDDNDDWGFEDDDEFNEEYNRKRGQR